MEEQPEGNPREERMRQLLDKRKAEEQLKAALRKSLDTAAYERLMNVKLSNPELFALAARYVAAGSQRLGRPLTDGELRTVLARLKGENERPTSITFDRK
jgi:DNA-binding TFAR19-related protein (PDSD5 family)